MLNIKTKQKRTVANIFSIYTMYIYIQTTKGNIDINASSKL